MIRISRSRMNNISLDATDGVLSIRPIAEAVDHATDSFRFLIKADTTVTGNELAILIEDYSSHHNALNQAELLRVIDSDKPQLVARDSNQTYFYGCSVDDITGKPPEPNNNKPSNWVGVGEVISLFVFNSRRNIAHPYIM
jgi:hypothetical protein